MKKIVWIAVLVIGMALFGCDTTDENETGNGGTDGKDVYTGPMTICDWPTTASGSGTKGYGETCASDAECKYGKCLMPGEDGNMLNDKFGFCTRGCDCGDDATSRLTDEEKQTFFCLYPPGFQGAKHHVAVFCYSLDDCTKVNPDWTECTMPSSGTVKKACQAH